MSQPCVTDCPKSDTLWMVSEMTGKVPVIKRLLNFHYIGKCDKCGHAVGYYGDGKELIHYLDLFPEDELADDINKTHCREPTYADNTRRDITELAQLFNKIKDLASQRNDAMIRFAKEWGNVFGVELPGILESGSEIDWQDVLVWGIDDASFDVFMKDQMPEKGKGDE